MKMITVIFVCTSNTCRSPMAEAFGKAWATENMVADDVTILSRGLTDRYEPPNSPASEYGVAVLLEKFGLDTSLHRSKLLTAEEVEIAAAIISVSSSHRDSILSSFPSTAHGKTYSLSRNVSDPWHASIDIYEHCACVMKPLVYEAMESIVRHNIK